MAGNSTGILTVRKDVKFNGLKIFSATMVADREQLGEKITRWMNDNQHCRPVEFVVTQSSDEAFHCVAITLFYNDDTRA
ncbi:MAG: hypothetical protein R3B06_24260 [Kofleriaceae bacterium]